MPRVHWEPSKHLLSSPHPRHESRVSLTSACVAIMSQAVNVTE